MKSVQDDFQFLVFVIDDRDYIFFDGEYRVKRVLFLLLVSIVCDIMIFCYLRVIYVVFIYQSLGKNIFG